jgi:hypothetical protein
MIIIIQSDTLISPLRVLMGRSLRSSEPIPPRAEGFVNPTRSGSAQPTNPIQHSTNASCMNLRKVSNSAIKVRKKQAG